MQNKHLVSPLSLSLSLSLHFKLRSRVCDLVCAVLFVAMRCLGLFFGFDFSGSNLSVSGFVLLLQTRKHLPNPTTVYPSPIQLNPWLLAVGGGSLLPPPDMRGSVSG